MVGGHLERLQDDSGHIATGHLHTEACEYCFPDVLEDGGRHIAVHGGPQPLQQRARAALEVTAALIDGSQGVCDQLLELLRSIARSKNVLPADVRTRGRVWAKLDRNLRQPLVEPPLDRFHAPTLKRSVCHGDEERRRSGELGRVAQGARQRGDAGKLLWLREGACVGACCLRGDRKGGCQCAAAPDRRPQLPGGAVQPCQRRDEGVECL
mmetsp:Transcript_131867/g.381376  ORF Transcript_131867/g.381376 Transcript_131867/m.381376 type:complete len:210 (-) Transcript_131867:114-743(-)